ncbi:MAG TPA: matrixin family metalloprotease [Pyrinomonadaceae bacterium]|nr:matrixin family metalloprotease [Pyrinomonadaceae bacterium]
MGFDFVKYFAVSLGLLIFISAASAYTAQFADEGKTIRLRWKTGVIPIALSSSLTKQNPGLKPDSDVSGAIRRSLDNWEKIANVKFEISIVDKQSVSPAGRVGDGVSLITIAQTPENLLLFGGDTGEVSARTQTFYNGKGIITEADIVLNPYQQFSTDGSIGTFDLEATLTHEIGHLLGLEHSFISGATMFEHQGKNGTYGLPGFAARTLAEDDISGIRALYGAKNNNADCCGALAGKILPANGKTAKNIQIWIEEAETGRVAAGALTNVDGSFRLEGLSAGKYFIYGQQYGEGKDLSAAQSLGETEVVKGRTVNFAKRLKFAAKTFDVSYIGFNGQISELAVPINGGKTFLIYVGGKNLDIENLKIGFNSPNLSVVAGSAAKQDYGAEISVISFEAKVAFRTPPGEYSFFLRGKNDETAYVIGSLTIDDFVNPWSGFMFSPTD